MKKGYINIDLKLVGSLCNLNCKYCYEHDLYGNHDTGKIDVNDIISYIDSLIKEYSKISITLHGGEPLLYRKEDMKKLLMHYKENKNINIGIQTNGLLIDQEWIDIFKNYSSNFLFSVSIDSKESLSREMNNEKLFNILKLIKQNGLQIGVLSLISKENINIDKFIYFINFLVDNIKVDFLTINKIRLNKNNLINSNENYITELDYTNFLIDIFKYWIDKELYKKIKINPFLDIFQNKKGCSYNNDLQKCKYFITIYPPFKFKGCDHEIGQSENISNCLKCDILNFCGGGCHYNFRDETFCEARFLLYSFIQEFSKK